MRKELGLCFIVLIYVLNCVRCGSLKYEKFQGNVCFEDETDFKLSDMTYAMCLDACQARVTCTAITMHVRMHLCRLHFGSAPFKKQCPGPGIVYSAKSSWHKKQADSCACETGETCNAVTRECQITECSPPESIQNGDILGNLRAIGANIVYTCDSGFNLTGSKGSTCLAKGRWSLTDASLPVCMKDCVSEAPSGTNTIIPTVTSTTAGSTIQYQCLTGYQITANEDLTLTCTQDGNWGSPPVCWKSCAAVAPSGTNTNTPEVTSTLPGSTIRYDCIGGYQIMSQEDLTLTCTLNGEWDTPPVCWKECTSVPPSGTNTNIPTVMSTTPGSTIQYECLAGYQIDTKADLTLTCTEDGQWGSPPTCWKFCDPRAPSGANTFDPIVLSQRPGAVTTYTCMTGYVPNESAEMTVTCANDGSWGSPPTCVKEPCEAGWTRQGDVCRFFVGTPASWYTSQTYCSSLGANLANIYSLEDLKAIKSVISCEWDTLGCNPWLGMNDIESEGQFLAVTGHTLSEAIVNELIVDNREVWDCSYYATFENTTRMYPCLDSDSCICEK